MGKIPIFHERCKGFSCKSWTTVRHDFNRLTKSSEQMREFFDQGGSSSVITKIINFSERREIVRDNKVLSVVKTVKMNT